MKTRQLGANGARVSAIGLGCMGLSFAYGQALEEAQAINVLQHALDRGVTFFDTAEVYGPFTNEVVVGKALKAARDRVTIATKFGFKIDTEAGRPTGVDSRPEHIRNVCDASLKRLGVETIDLFYQHRVDPNVPIEDVAGAVGELVKDGKVRMFGLSEAGADNIRRAHAVHPVAALQSEYSLWSRDQERATLPVCLELGIAFVAYSPLGRGFLAGGGTKLADTDFRRNLPRWQGEALKHNQERAQALAALAEQKRCTAAQLALAWLLHQSDDIIPIPGTTKPTRLDENIGAVEIKLSADDLATIERAAGAAEGDRYDAMGLRMIDS